MSSQIRVLHVDDDADFAEMTATFLEQEDARMAVETVDSASEALDRLAAEGFDCVVSDYEMPGMDGIEFLEAVRERDEDHPFVLFTGKGSEAVAGEAVEAGATAYLQKGTGPEQYQLLAKRIVDAVELRQAETNYREIFETVPDGILVQDPEDGSFVDVNAEYVEMFGYEREELMAAGFDAVLPDEPPYTREDAIPQIRKTVEHGSRTFEWPGVRKDGERFWTEVHLTPTRLGGEDRILAVVRDVSERKERERELREEKAKVEALHDVATEIGACETEDAVFEAIVDAAESTLDFDIAIVDAAEDDVLVPRAVSSELSAEQYYDETPVDDDDNVAATAFRAGEPSVVDDVRTHEVAPADAAFRSALTVPIGEYGVFQTVAGSPGAYDETDLELVETLVAHARERLARIEGERRLRERTDELARQNERLDEFVSIVSHDLRNPLNVADGHLELAADECDSDHLAEVARSHERMGTLIDDLLTLTRGSERVGDPEGVDLGTLAERCWRNVETGDADLAVGTDRTVRADRSRLQQVFENLVGNAVEHGDPAATVTVGDLDDGFYVEDDGAGIPADESEHVFEYGYSTAEDGTGFGLAIVERIATAHGWEVELVAGRDGGARFEFTGVEFADGS